MDVRWCLHLVILYRCNCSKWVYLVFRSSYVFICPRSSIRSAPSDMIKNLKQNYVSHRLGALYELTVWFMKSFISSLFYCDIFFCMYFTYNFIIIALIIYFHIEIQNELPLFRSNRRVVEGESDENRRYSANMNCHRARRCQKSSVYQ